MAERKIPDRSAEPAVSPDQAKDGANLDDREESDEEQQARESEKAFDQAITRIPPG